MELDGYLRATLRRRTLVISLTLLGGIIAFVLSYLTPVRYDVAVASTIQRVNGQNTEQFQYDEYYALQSVDLVAQTIVSWFATPSFVVAVYEEAGFDPAVQSVNELSRRFEARKYSGQNVVINFTQESRDSAEKLAQGIIALVGERVPQLVQDANDTGAFAIDFDAPVISERKANQLLDTILGLLVGLFVALFIAAAQEALSRDTQSV
ncbi:MAG: hypothetical protein H6760_01640 [Candidatus Nomurabacteria bacterium]|nr:MAG: hypothetical protein H6760_01640 [Candidatus Nomurabacteria bacterium]